LGTVVVWGFSTVRGTEICVCKSPPYYSSHPLMATVSSLHGRLYFP
jgi:hypothetical protein